MGLKFHKCNQNDIDELLNISYSTFYDKFAPFNTPEDLKSYMDMAFNYQQIMDEIETVGSAFYFACDQENIVGYFKTNTGKAQAEQFNEETFELARFYVKTEFQNYGYGKEMLHKVIDLARETSAIYIWLGVWEHNSGAIKFYERNGFEKFSQHPFLMGTDLQTDNLMRLYL